MTPSVPVRRRFVVVRHSSDNGYVVRTTYVDDDGRLERLPSPYGDSPIVGKPYVRESAAQRYADVLNGYQP